MSAIVITNEQTEYYHRVTYRATITGAAPERAQFADQAMFRPACIQVTYEYANGHWGIAELRTYGPNVRKDGADGKNRHGTDYTFDDPPDWVEAIVNEHRPKGELCLRDSAT